MVTHKGLKGWSVKQHVIKLRYDDDDDDDNNKRNSSDTLSRIRRTSRRTTSAHGGIANSKQATVNASFRDNPANITLMRRADSMSIMIGDCVKFEDPSHVRTGEEENKKVGLIKRIDVDLPYRIDITVISMYSRENVLNNIKNLVIPFEPIDENELFITPIQTTIKLEHIRSKVTVYSQVKYKEKGLIGNETGGLFFCERACDTAYFSQPFDYDEVLEKIFDSSIKLNTYLVNLIFYENKDYTDKYGQRKDIIQKQQHEAKLKARETLKIKEDSKEDLTDRVGIPKRKRRGRPRKDSAEISAVSSQNSKRVNNAPINEINDKESLSAYSADPSFGIDSVPKRKRGRPKKNAFMELALTQQKNKLGNKRLDNTYEDKMGDEENDEGSSDDFIVLSDDETSESDFIDDDDSDYEEGIKQTRRKRRVKGALSKRGKRKQQNILAVTDQYGATPQIPKRFATHVGDETMDEISLIHESHTTHGSSKKQRKLASILFQNAKERLHTSALLASLPCREEEFAQIYLALESLILQEMGSCLYISGTPGTGKTATVRKVISELLKRLQQNQMMDEMRRSLKNGNKKYKKEDIEKIKSKLKQYVGNDDKIYQFINGFNFVEINGLKLITPNTAYEILWEKISGQKLSANNSKNAIEHYLLENEAGEFPDRKPLIVLMDEIDQIVTKNQGIMYNFFNWPTYNNSKLIVIAIANTMDLPERVLTNKISSRLGLSRILFPGYTHDQLSKIIERRIGELDDANSKNCFNKKKLKFEKSAMEFASRKVASVSGDARRALSICRRAVEIAEQYYVDQKKKHHGRDMEDNEKEEIYYIKIQHIITAIQETTHSPVSLFIMNLTVMQKIFLVSQLRRQKYSGFSENELYDVIVEMKRVISMNFLDCNDKNYESPLLASQTGWDNNIFEVFLKNRGEVSNRNKNIANTANIDNCLNMQSQSLTFMINQLTEAGIIAQERKKSNQSRMVKLIVPEDEVYNALRKEKIFQKVLGT